MINIKPTHTIAENASLLQEWDYEKNDALGLFPEKLGASSNKTVWWLCRKGHSFDMRITQRTRGQCCPYCSNTRVLPGFNDLATTNPELLSQWDYEKNTIPPNSVSHGSDEKVWWKCNNGHCYQQALNKKTSRNSGCPVCSGHLIVSGVNDFATTYPELAKEWHSTKNTLNPSKISKKSGQKAWWICRYGHEWQATPHDRVTDNTGCPICSQRRLTSFPEQALFFYIKKLYPDAINRYTELFDNGMELDIYVPSIRFAVEFDGATWHTSEDAHRRERLKYDICQQNKITLCRVKEHIENGWHDVADDIYIIHKRKAQSELQAVIQSIIDSIDPSSIRGTRKDLRCFHSLINVNLERDANEIREYLTPIPNSLVDLRPDLVKEWNVEKNGSIRPELFGINSNNKVWWKCSKCGHEWKTSIIHRGGKRNSGCPECAKVKKGQSFTKRRVGERGSLAEKNPSLAAEWHPSKNGILTPADITEKRFANVWWLCPKCGYEWESSPNHRSKGVGCPCCSGRVPKTGVNDFKTLYPGLSAEWNYDKNGDKLPEFFLPKSGKKVWWRCRICGYEWEAVIRSRTIGHGCPKYRSHVQQEQCIIDSYFLEKKGD